MFLCVLIFLKIIRLGRDIAINKSLKYNEIFASRMHTAERLSQPQKFFPRLNID